MISNMASAWNHGQMELNMRVHTLTVKRKVKENLLLLMAVITKVNLSRMRFVDTENISGQTANSMKVNGAKIKCMGKVRSYGKTRRNIKDSLSMINVKVQELSVGLMVDSMLVSGRLVNNMDMVLILVLKVKENLDSGKMVRK